VGLLDAPLGRVATTLIRQFGRTVELRRYPEAVYDPATSRSVVTPIVQFPTAIAETLTARSASGLGADVRAGDLRFLLAGADITDGPPDQTWDLVLQGRRHELVAVETVSAGDDPTLVVLIARGAP
jgi:hypothetical protein